MKIYVVRTFRDCFATANFKAAKQKAESLFKELQLEYEKCRVNQEEVWSRIDVYCSRDHYDFFLEYSESIYAKKK